ncbi:MAG: hypothetical protein AAFO69_15505 [Bacteroidota bacterium]
MMMFEKRRKVTDKKHLMSTGKVLPIKQQLSLKGGGYPWIDKDKDDG